MMLSGIYAIVNILNDKVYIGSAVDFRSRWRNHRSQLNRNVHDNIFLQRSWNKYNSCSFMFVVLEYVWLHSDLIKREQFWIDELNVCNDQFGYNIRRIADSNLGIKRSVETRAKIGAASRGRVASEETKRKTSKALTGIKRSEASKARMSAAQKGRKITESQSVAITAANKRREGVKYNKLNRVWPCADGQKCKCKECTVKKNLASRESKRKRRLIDYDNCDFIPLIVPFEFSLTGKENDTAS